MLYLFPFVHWHVRDGVSVFLFFVYLQEIPHSCGDLVSDSAQSLCTVTQVVQH